MLKKKINLALKQKAWFWSDEGFIPVLAGIKMDFKCKRG